MISYEETIYHADKSNKFYTSSENEYRNHIQTPSVLSNTNKVIHMPRLETFRSRIITNKREEVFGWNLAIAKKNNHHDQNYKVIVRRSYY